MLFSLLGLARCAVSFGSRGAVCGADLPLFAVQPLCHEEVVPLYVVGRRMVGTMVVLRRLGLPDVSALFERPILFVSSVTLDRVGTVSVTNVVQTICMVLFERQRNVGEE